MRRFHIFELDRNSNKNIDDTSLPDWFASGVDEHDAKQSSKKSDRKDKENRIRRLLHTKKNHLTFILQGAFCLSTLRHKRLRKSDAEGVRNYQAIWIQMRGWFRPYVLPPPPRLSPGPTNGNWWH